MAAALTWQGRDRLTPEPRRFLEGVHARVPPGATRAAIRAAFDMPADTVPGKAAEVLGSGQDVSAQDTVPFCLWKRQGTRCRVVLEWRLSRRSRMRADG